jgi:hypothetical protein
MGGITSLLVTFEIILDFKIEKIGYGAAFSRKKITIYKLFLYLYPHYW